MDKVCIVLFGAKVVDLSLWGYHTGGGQGYFRGDDKQQVQATKGHKDLESELQGRRCSDAVQIPAKG